MNSILKRDGFGRVRFLFHGIVDSAIRSRIGWGLWWGAGIAVAILPSPKLGPFARGYLTLYFLAFEYVLVFGSVLATVATLVQEHRRASSPASTRSNGMETFWKILFSPVLLGLIFIVGMIFMYLPLTLGHIAQVALYGDHPTSTVFMPESLLYPFNWPHFLRNER